MKRLFLTSFLALLILVTPVAAQQAGDNVNVLPVVPRLEPGDENFDPNWYLKGDGFLQRQLEATIGASTLNPDHLLAFFNDYRAVDIQDDVGLGEGEITNAALKLARILLPPEFGNTLPKGVLVPPINAAEAWIGGSRSYDGGYTWSGFFLPGAPLEFYQADPDFPDETPPDVSTSAPIYGLEAATDPVLACGPCGTFYLAFVAFTRGGESAIAVARYRDTNNFEGGDTIVYEDMTIIESGNNAEYGYFLDKPDIEVDVFRNAAVAAKVQPGSGDPVDSCAHRVYVTYSTFNGLTKDQKIQTSMNFAVSEDGGDTFATTKINKNFGQNQGSAIAVDPRPGTPGETGGGTVYVFWRHFFDPHAIIATKTTDYGVKWSAPVIITSEEPLVPFDQPTISVENAIKPTGPPEDEEGPAINHLFPEVAFRSNGFPTAVVAARLKEDGNSDNGNDWIATPFVAWQERVGSDSAPGIVMMKSTDEGGTWSGLGTNGARMAVDMDDRYEPFDPALLMPDLSQADQNKHFRHAGGQVQPRLSIGPGQMLLTFYESRGRIGDYGSVDEFMAYKPEYAVDFTEGITGYDRVLDFRGTLLDPETGIKFEDSSTQISRYPIRLDADLSNGQDLSDVAPLNTPCFPDSEVEGDPICVRQVNRSNAVTSALGSVPFIGDYPDTVPFTQFVPDENGGWRWAIRPGDVPNRGFHAIWTDNRHLLPPFEALDPDTGETKPISELGVNEWDAAKFYGPPGIEGACFNPGSRNTDVLTSRVDTDVIVNAPTTFKQLDADRSFPFSVSNKTLQFRRFRIDVIWENFPIEGVDVSLSPVDPGKILREVEVFPYSSTSLTVWVDLPDLPPDTNLTTEIGPIRLAVTLLESKADAKPETPWIECDDTVVDCLVGFLTFNADSGNQPVENLIDPETFDALEEDFGPQIGDAFVINWDINNTGDPDAFVINPALDNAFVINSTEENAFVINPTEENAFVINAFVINAFVINKFIYDVTDVTWTMTPGSANTAASYLPIVNIDDAEQFLENGDYAFQLIVDKPSAYGSALECGKYAANIHQQQVLSNVIQDPNAFVINQDYENAFVINKSPQNAFVINSTEENAFVINSTFAIAPSESPTTQTDEPSGLKREVIPDAETRAKAPSNEVRITLRAYQLRSDSEIETAGRPLYKPDPREGGWLPSVAVAEISCGADENQADCFTVDGPDLIPSTDFGPPEGETLSIDRCDGLTIPADTFTVTNKGVKDAVSREGEQRHGFYLSRFGAGGELTFNLFLKEFTSPKRLPRPVEPPDNTNSVSNPEITLEIPADAEIEDGLYTLVFFADHPLKVSEYDELNNDDVQLQILVTSSGASEYVFEGSSPLVLGMISTANAGSVVPLSWKYYDPEIDQFIDSSAAEPVITFSGWTGEGIDCSNYKSDPESGFDIRFQKDEDPGSSGLRYISGGWQFNWQTKVPDGDIYSTTELNPGDPLPHGCYEITISSDYTCGGQGEGPFLVTLN